MNVDWELDSKIKTYLKSVVILRHKMCIKTFVVLKLFPLTL